MEAMRSAVILAGGAGSRLGKEKSLVEFGGRPLIQWSVQKLAPFVEDIVVVARGPEQASQLLDRIGLDGTLLAPALVRVGVIIVWLFDALS